MPAATTVAPFALKPAAQQFAESTAGPPYLPGPGPGERRKAAGEVRPGKIGKPAEDRFLRRDAM